MDDELSKFLIGVNMAAKGDCLWLGRCIVLYLAVLSVFIGGG
jgi:hypothetical protein